MGQILEAALGPEVAYWRSLNLTCADLAQTLWSTRAAQPDNVKIVLIRKSRWYFLEHAHTRPAAAGAGPGGNETKGDGGSAGEARDAVAWPPLKPASGKPGSCPNPCHGQLGSVYSKIRRVLKRFKPGVPHRYRYDLPDMVFVLNTADNERRYGLYSRAPIISLLKTWRVPWWPTRDDGSPAANLSLGRVDGRLVEQIKLSPTFRQHLDEKLRGTIFASPSSATPSNTSSPDPGPSTPDPDPDPLRDTVRRFVSRRSPSLPPGLDLPALLAGRANASAAPQRSAVRKGVPDMDLLIPTLYFVANGLAYYPWDKKRDIAFFRGTPYCPFSSPHGLCPRVFLADLSRRHPGALDVGVVGGYRGRPGPKHKEEVDVPPATPTPIRDHARYRYLLNIDGITGSTRMGLLMTTNSVVLKGRSPYIEFYSRLQTPGVHYLEYWKNPKDPQDVLQTLQEARAAAEGDPEGREAAIAANQAIAASYLLIRSKLILARAVLLAYAQLFPGGSGTCSWG
ncbi:hypothetical protein HYH03_015829 [Edaphochlamys debaryana]|uniref:Glycosyl transferase CAP10 domain-containing protein n=1 Tax=Edaphochlamys debaryana TaxID=47281 RepID=A0A835XNJ5_9CHLO|nr:hypothetical protein HYH03_015829 [Edaphochlamys debaryana]|eukprot:KAG2485451.1 hypothetical protein HYH03_015829 [Edaphochlamys debaryana]